MKRRVLIVVSSYRPAMLADMQRARMLAWELPALGWDVEVLTPACAEVRDDVREPDAAGFFPAPAAVHEVGSVLRPVFELLGSRSPAWRTWWPMERKGSELLASGRFDLVYLSTTTFGYFLLGSEWRRKFGVPYVLDLHDPWIREDGRGAGRGLSSRIARALNERLESRAVVNAGGLVSVSPAYIEALRRRYERARPSWLADERRAVIPFGALASDLAEAARTSRPRVTDANEIAVNYVGAGGQIMERSFSLICGALAELRARRHPLAERVRIRLYGTTYGWKAGDPRVLEAAARAAGVGDLVEEFPQRVSYRRSLELLLEPDGALILGVDEAGYALSGKPLLAAVRSESPALALLSADLGLAHTLRFDAERAAPAAESAGILANFLEQAARRRAVDRTAALEPFLARSMARRHAALFEACLGKEGARA